MTEVPKATQWTGFYMIETSIMKELKFSILTLPFKRQSHKTVKYI